MDMMVTKIFQVVAEKADDGFVAVISTGAEDRDGDVVVPSGAVLGNYQKNPVVLWGHDHSVPAIGKALWVKATKRDVRAKIEWARTPFANEIRSLYEDGILHSFSIGFMPLEYEERRDKAGNLRGYKFTKWELLEFSAVNVPANPEALAVRAKGLSPVTRRALGLAETTEKAVIPYKEYPLDPEDAEWSAAEEVRAADVEDLREMCAWYDAENPDVKASYKLPHHRANNKHTVWRGVAAAMGALLGARGGVNIPEGDRKGVYNHLAKHYRDFGKEPPEFRSYDLGELVDLHIEGAVCLPYKWVERLAAFDGVVETSADVSRSSETGSTGDGRVFYGDAVAALRDAFSAEREAAELRRAIKSALGKGD